MHALGAWHEQQRSDRDEYVTIEWSNIEVGKEHNFEIPMDAKPHGPYDFDSVMHYGACYFSSCDSCSTLDPDCRTITALPPNEPWQEKMGQRDHLSNGDAGLLQTLYPSRPSAKLLPDDGAEDDQFGYSVAISGNTGIVGARDDDDNGGKSGSAYLFDVASGQQLAKLLPDDGAPGDLFGASVSIRGDTAIVGATEETMTMD